ncbi:glycerophosphoryl diester phosphodiesterase membrane domain-containing protein [Pedococcus sp. NPDC057267]|uniref:glycerophosphoryl diester phosphodiesterase membrane domain-containing protein n=1 Tax=Pedococcus sp. NPDC057267 TaxID=3346077 RepID=UPI003643B263
MTQPAGGNGSAATPGWSAPGSPTPPEAPVAPGAAAPPGSPVPPQAQYAPPQPPAYAGSGAPGTALPPAHWSSALTAHKPGIIPLRPLGLGDMIEGGFAAMRRNPRTFFGLALLVTLAVVVLLGTLGALGYLAATTFGGSASDAVLAVGAVGGLSLLYVLTAVTGVVLTGMLSYPVGEAVLGRKPTTGEVWRHTRRMIPRLTGLCLLMLVPVVVVFGGLVALVVLAFSRGSDAGGVVALLAVLVAVGLTAYLTIRVVLATPALVLEDLGVVASLKRSWRLTEGRFWRTLGVLVVTGLLVGIVQQVLGFGFQFAGMALGFGLVSTTHGDPNGPLFALATVGTSVLGAGLAALLTQPFSAAVSALLYTDARIRAEGFDLALARAVSGAPVGL